MHRSPIEMMIDKACGVTAEDLVRPPPKRAVQAMDRETQALLNVADAAKAWHLDPSRDGSAAALHAACAEWVALGG